MTNETYNVGIYCRLSNDDERDGESVSIENQKLLLQLIVTGCFCWYLHAGGTGTAVYIPFTNGMLLDLGILFIPFVFIAMLGTVNGVNLTDGLDGLSQPHVIG